MFFGKRDKDVRLTDKQYKNLTSNMSKKERREFERCQDELRREREEDRLLGWLEFEEELDDIDQVRDYFMQAQDNPMNYNMCIQ